MTARWEVVDVEARIRCGRIAYMGRGRTLAEAVAVLSSYLDEADVPVEELAAMRAALGAGFHVEMVSVGQWWNPFSWGRITFNVSPGPRP